VTGQAPRASGETGAHRITCDRIIEASWEALVDSLEAGVLPGRAQGRPARQAVT
jgi:hypothetical protein